MKVTLQRDPIDREVALEATSSSGRLWARVAIRNYGRDLLFQVGRADTPRATGRIATLGVGGNLKSLVGAEIETIY